MNSMDDDDVAHLAGYLDARGRITVHVVQDDSYSIGYNLRPTVRIHIPEDHELFLGKLMAYCDETGVRFSESEREDGGSTLFEVKRHDSISRLLEPMLPYLTAKFDAAHLMVEGLLPGMADGHHRTKQGFIELLERAEPLRHQDSATSKHTAEDFYKRWEDDLTV